MLNVSTDAPMYTWTQTLEEVSVRLKLPHETRGRDLDVTFAPTSIAVVHRPSATTLLCGTLLQNIKHEDSTWDIDDDILELTLTKAIVADFGELKQRWSCVIVGHPLIDVNEKGIKQVA